jgi:hypothetical protein
MLSLCRLGMYFFWLTAQKEILHGSFIIEDKDMFYQKVGNHFPRATLSHLGRSESLATIYLLSILSIHTRLSNL